MGRTVARKIRWERVRRNQVASVLVVEDDDGVRRVLRRALEAEGHVVLEARSAEEGLRLATKERPELVITDLNLPGMNGDELIRRLKAFSKRPKVIAMTGVMTALAQVEWQVDAGLQKPIDLDELEEKVRKVMR